jgi:hypothetical protein
MKKLYLADLKGETESAVKKHIASEYAGEQGQGYDYGSQSDTQKEQLHKTLKGFDVVIAYESVGSWGCDSTSWFLLRNKKTGRYIENHGSHCSCYGFEGQWNPEKTTKKYLKSSKFYFHCGGYDNEETENQKAVKEFLKKL